MADYLSYKFEDGADLVSTFDELPLWSASFGLLLLKHLELKPNLTVLDIGSGGGFPLLELAQRLGPSSRCYGIDPWKHANERARQKIRNYGVKNVTATDGTADDLPFADATFDLIVSNLGINNFEHPQKVMGECYRVLRPGGRLAITTNLNGHWQAFYDVFKETLAETGHSALLTALTQHQEHRGSVSSVKALFEQSGLAVTKQFEETLEMNFLDGTALLNHSFVKLGWLGGWKEVAPATAQEAFFDKLEENLNAYAAQQGSLRLSVPMLYLEGSKG